MDTKKLRQKILDLAIHGKLVPQDPNDEPASVLLERIKAEKERLIQEGKIKRPKKSTADTSHYQNWPYEIPNGWEWIRLEDLLTLLSGQDFPPEKYNERGDGIPYVIGASNIENEELIINRWTDSPSVISIPNDILIVCKGSGVGKIAKNNIGKVHIARQIQAIRDETETIESEYIKICIYNNISDIISKANGLIPGLKRELLLSLSLPIPPLQEQKRIVSVVKEYLSLMESIETNTFDLQSAIGKAKKEVLNLAIQGELVPQNPDEEPAIELLKRINPNIKIPCDNPHYQKLPVGWSMCRLEDIVDYEQPQAYIVESTDYSDDYDIPVLTAGKTFIIGYTNEETGICDNLPVIIFDDFTTDSKYVEFPFKVKSSAMKILRVRRGIDIKYVAAFMAITRLIGKTHKRYWISEYSKIEIPIPPQKEQERIIMAIEQITARLNSITTML